MSSSKNIPEARIPKETDQGRECFDAAAFEEANVHGVYSSIAPHFSSTRYKPWPLIPLFLSTLPPNSLGADMGTGNGKYLHLESAFAARSNDKGKGKAKDLVTLGVDRSRELLELAQSNDGQTTSLASGETSEMAAMTNEVAVGDAIASGLRYGVFDFAISIATIHHLSTFERRRTSVEELIRLVRPVARQTRQSATSSEPSGGPSELASGPGRFLIFVWALEQREEGKRTFEAEGKGAEEAGRAATSDERESQGRDLLVPWVFNEPGARKGRKKGGKAQEGVSGQADEAPKAGQMGQAAPQQAKDEEGRVFHRFYHVFAAGELESLVDAAARHLAETEPSMAGVDVCREASGWERGNWWGVWQVVRRDEREDTQGASRSA